MTSYTPADVDTLPGYAWTCQAEAEDGYVAAALVRGEPVIVMKVASQSGDYDDEGEQDVWVVVQVGTQLFRKDGYYYSHSGHIWNTGLKEVKPVVKTVTVYE